MLTRRRFAVLAASALASPALIRSASAAEAPAPLRDAIQRFGALPATASCLVACDQPGASWQASLNPEARLFVGSAVKSLMLAAYLREVEAGRLTLEEEISIDDAVRSPSSPVYLQLLGMTPARSVLEAMIAHSDNTATDAVLAAVTPARVRALIAEAGLRSTQIPDSTRRLYAHLAGAPEGVDIGWDGMQKIIDGRLPGTPRAPMNKMQTMASSAEDLVAWYRRSLKGEFFKTPGSLAEYKRIEATATALPQVVPPDTVAYGKGGSIDWEGFHCLCIAGQMIADKVPVTFCFTINWKGPNEGVTPVFTAYRSAVAGVLGAASASV